MVTGLGLKVKRVVHYILGVLLEPYYNWGD